MLNRIGRKDVNMRIQGRRWMDGDTRGTYADTGLAEEVEGWE